jgi:hypothetical protein
MGVVVGGKSYEMLIVGLMQNPSTALRINQAKKSRSFQATFCKQNHC